MRLKTRFVALGLAAFMLASCAHKDKNAPLAFVPADTPYVFANLDTLNAKTREALLTQADAQLPSYVAQLNVMAARNEQSDPHGTRLLRALADELKGKTVEDVAQNAGIKLDGYAALYGLGLSPVLRLELNNTQAFEGFIDHLEGAYGQKLDTAHIANQRYRRYVSKAAGTQIILAVVGKQAVMALLPADAAPAMLRLALGLDRPKHSMQDDNRLAKRAKAKGYKPWNVGDMDMTRVLPLAFGGKDPLIEALRKAHAEAESAKTGEPLADQLLQTPPSCASEAMRIAARVPEISFGYTRVDDKHQDVRLDVSLASDISKAFSGLKVALPGLGEAGSAPFDLSLALPVTPLRTFWSAQADAVAAKPFTCPGLTDLNDGFAKLGPATQKAAIPPFGDLLGVRIALDTLSMTPESSLPNFTGRIVLASKNPAGLLAMGQMMVPALAQLKVTPDGKPTALPEDMSKMLGGPAWIASTGNALALGVGAGEQGKLADTLKQPNGDAGRLARMHLSGDMYLDWLKLMEKKIDSLASTVSALTPSTGGATSAEGDQLAANAARSKAQLATMKAQAARVSSIDGEAHIDDDGLVITSQTALK